MTVDTRLDYVSLAKETSDLFSDAALAATSRDEPVVSLAGG